MAAFIFDASGIVKRYLTETGTAWVQGLTDPAAAHEIFLTRLTRVDKAWRQDVHCVILGHHPIVATAKIHLGRR